MARRLLALIPLVLITLGWAGLLGVDLGWYDARFALCVLVLLGMGSAVVLVAYQARVLYRVDLERQRMTAAVQALNLSLEDTVQARTRDLERALAQVKQLTGLLPICAWCKKIRNDNNYWQEVEGYLSDHTDAQFTHGICPQCATRLRAEWRRSQGTPEESRPYEPAEGVAPLRGRRERSNLPTADAVAEGATERDRKAGRPRL